MQVRGLRGDITWHTCKKKKRGHSLEANGQWPKEYKHIQEWSSLLSLITQCHDQSHRDHKKRVNWGKTGAWGWGGGGLGGRVGGGLGQEVCGRRT